MCRSGVPSFSTIDQTMKMLGAKAFWEVFGFFSFSWRNFKKKTISKMKFRKTNKVGKFEVKKVKNKGAVSKNVVRVAITPLQEVRCSFYEFSNPIPFCSNLVETFFNPFPIRKCKKNWGSQCWFSRWRWSKFPRLHTQFRSGFFY